MKIFEISLKPDLQEKAIENFWKCWRSDSNLPFYRVCLKNSIAKKNIQVWFEY